MGTKKTLILFIIALLLLLTSCGLESETNIEVGGALTPVPEAVKPAYGVDAFDTQIRARDGMAMVYVPAGQFRMGNDQVGQESPAHPVVLDAYWIDQTEVTNAMFSRFLSERGNQVEEGIAWLEPGAGHRGVVYGHIEENDGVFRPEVGFEDYPVIEVSWYGAAAYCAWVGGRLPTEAEWEYAGRGPQASIYPWGDTFDGEGLNYCDASCRNDWKDAHFNDGSVEWTAVGSYPGGASWCGALDMAGNVWEWVHDWWSDEYYAHSPAENPQGPDGGTVRIGRGGSWYDPPEHTRASFRKGLSASSSRMHWIGFRCVIPAQP